MLKLIKLELRRNHLKTYIYAVLGIFLFTLCIGILFGAIPKIDANDLSSNIFSNAKFLVTMISVISMSAFAILGAVMHTKLIVEEYTGKKNILLFSYPQKRSNILLAKYFIVFIFTFIMMTVSNIISILFVWLIGNLSGIMSISLKNTNFITISILFSFIANLISLISLRVGFWKKSIVSTIITSVILVSPMGNSVVLLSDNLVFIVLPILIILIAINIILFLGLIKKVSAMEGV